MIKINGIEVVFNRFPNGESRMEVEGLMITNHEGIANLVSFKYEDDSDLIKLQFVKKYLDNYVSRARSVLKILYMPYSRMDRTENDSPFTLKYVSDFINSLGFDKVKILEPHSDVTPALINNSKAIYINYKLLNKVKGMVGFDDETDYIVFPDNGASKRYSKMEEENVLIGHKNRDFKTGEITSLDIIGKNTGGDTAIIVDDLSSYGGTFLKTAIELRKLGVEKVYLLVAHAENSIFKGELFEHVDKVFTTDSILTDQNNWENKKFESKLHIFKYWEGAEKW